MSSRTALIGLLVISTTIAASSALAAADSKKPFKVLTAVTAAHGSTTAKASPLVGRWQIVRTCQGLVDALRETGLAPLAPTVVGDYFPNQTPADLAKKKNICAGAKPQLHSHFFTTGGQFGSVDQHGKQVDDGSYRVLNANTVKIGDSTFKFRIQGRTLMLRPLLIAAEKQAALAKPLDWATAGWMVAVSYLGHRWHRVACASWC